MKKYKINHAYTSLICFVWGLSFLFISILLTLSIKDLFNEPLMIKILFVLYWISIMCFYYGFYHKFVKDEIIINDGIIQNRRFITEN